MKLLIATHNQGKKKEYEVLLAGLPVELVNLSDLGIAEAVEENGETYAENAQLKARNYASKSGLLTLADDSGLEVDYLNGEPGVRSARYDGGQGTDEDRYQLLLEKLDGVPEKQRTARFRCVIALAWPDGRTELTEGTIEGRITFKPQGRYGFGYDPVFYVPQYGRTMADLPPEVKNRISHRARAASAARDLLHEELK